LKREYPFGRNMKMHQIIYLVGLVVIVLAIVSFVA